ncbi:hypothetical protein BST22_12040 [Mycolicibacterium chubuense]|uniref:Clp R domain-containing protein n=1 Tax=Mycolicibacterium chubuense TaxID=1800 RepID=A0A0J6VMV3_MYCCU|nr:Clp protease N-terminal domain-containing protein [Mycolicibacterium chubuense]KMO71509.1 hypothetical protein MCHUDSM44219_05212 [Mycolicibacterium chubuense]ORA52328.1 hypothetical protein BST22_12040 [Mycolicibacterium chubuense]SPX99663.1 Uncharacterised protein [Mycolicibacterium chubuense]
MAGDVSAHFSDDGRAAVAAATAAARDGSAAEVTSEHLLAGVLRHADQELRELLTPFGLTADTARRRCLPGRPGDPVVDAPAFSKRVKEILRLANLTARQDDGRIGCAGIFVALMLRRDSAVMAYLRDKAEVDRLTSAARALTQR